MRAVIQRVTRASVEVEGRVVGSIRSGLLVLLGVARGDGDADCRFIVDKLRGLRIFADEAGKMNRSLTDTGGGILSWATREAAGAPDLKRPRRPMKRGDGMNVCQKN